MRNGLSICCYRIFHQFCFQPGCMPAPVVGPNDSLTAWASLGGLCLVAPPVMHPPQREFSVFRSPRSHTCLSAFYLLDFCQYVLSPVVLDPFVLVCLYPFLDIYCQFWKGPEINGHVYLISTLIRSPLHDLCKADTYLCWASRLVLGM